MEKKFQLAQLPVFCCLITEHAIAVAKLVFEIIDHSLNIQVIQEERLLFFDLTLLIFLHIFIGHFIHNTAFKSR